MTDSTAPGKVILFGEHAVVYQRPAIAVPVTQVHAQAQVDDAAPGDGITIIAHDLALSHVIGQPTDERTLPLETIVLATLDHLAVEPYPDLTIAVRSTIPIGSGMGSGAAVSAAIVQALSAHLGHPLPPEAVSPLVYQTEVLHHGTPSGIDNTVVSYAKPVYFVRDRVLETFEVRAPFGLAIADTGIFSPTKVAVSDVRCAWQADTPRYEALFDRIGAIADQARAAIEAGHVAQLGHLMNGNQALLEKLHVSCPELDALVAAARQAGALGAKLCGAGCGGNMIALIDASTQAAVVQALWDAGAANVLVTQVD